MSRLPLAVLLVEDDPNDVLFLRRALGKLGLSWEVEVASDGDEAVRRLESGSRPVTHVILDLKIPKKSGLEVLQVIRHRSHDIRVVILTSSREPSDLDRATKLGVDRYLIKAVSFPEFLGIIEEIARHWEVPREES